MCVLIYLCRLSGKTCCETTCLCSRCQQPITCSYLISPGITWCHVILPGRPRGHSTSSVSSYHLVKPVTELNAVTFTTYPDVTKLFCFSIRFYFLNSCNLIRFLFAQTQLREQDIVLSVSVCLSVCPQTRVKYHTRSKFSNFFC